MPKRLLANPEKYIYFTICDQLYRFDISKDVIGFLSSLIRAPAKDLPELMARANYHGELMTEVQDITDLVDSFEETQKLLIEVLKKYFVTPD